MPLDLLVIFGSVRADRQGIRAARFIVQACQARGHTVTLIDPASDKLPLLDRMYKEFPAGEAPEVLERLAGLIKQPTDSSSFQGNTTTAYRPRCRTCSTIFSRSTSGGRRAIVCYSAGAFGGVRAAMQLRAMLCELGTPSIPSLFPIARVQDAFDENGRPNDESYERRVGRFLDELEWYASALKVAGRPGRLTDQI